MKWVRVHKIRAIWVDSMIISAVNKLSDMLWVLATRLDAVASLPWQARGSRLRAHGSLGKSAEPGTGPQVRFHQLAEPWTGLQRTGSTGSVRSNYRFEPRTTKYEYSRFGKWWPYTFFLRQKSQKRFQFNKRYFTEQTLLQPSIFALHTVGRDIWALKMETVIHNSL